MSTQNVQELIKIPNAPVVEGLAFRRFRGEDDYPAMVRILNESDGADGQERTANVEEVAHYYSYLVNCDPYEDMVFVELDGKAEGYTRTMWWQEDDGPRLYGAFGWLTPSARGKGIATALLAYQEAHLREIAADHPADVEKLFQNGSSDTATAKNALLEKAGYRPIAFFATMVRPHLVDIPDLPLPDGVEVRSVEEADLRAIYEADVEAFRDHWGYTTPSEEHYQEWLEDPHMDTALWRVAWDGDEVVGQVRSYINQEENEKYDRKRGWTENISVRRPWRRQGVASALLARSLQAITERGMEEAALGVHTENPNGAYNLYERMGFEVVKTFTTYRKPFDR